jgi:hypothetical protein
VLGDDSTNDYDYYYTGTVTITITGDFGSASYLCKEHGNMGGWQNIEFDSTSTSTSKIKIYSTYNGDKETKEIENPKGFTLYSQEGVTTD